MKKISIKTIIIIIAVIAVLEVGMICFKDYLDTVNCLICNGTGEMQCRVCMNQENSSFCSRCGGDGVAECYCRD